jgi:hypothetical protein
MRRLFLSMCAVALVAAGAITPFTAAAADAGHAVRGFGSAHGLGAPSGLHLNAPLVGIAANPSHNGYWLLAQDGGVFTYGDTHFYGSTGGMRLKAPVVGIAATRTGRGYWLVASDGGVFSFGDARFYGSTGSLRLAKPVVGMAVTSSGHGYWLVASDGGVFAFGDARFHGSLGGRAIDANVVAIAAQPHGSGYAIAADNGAVFGFAGAASYDTGGVGFLSAPIVSLAYAPGGHGVWVLAGDGAVYSYGQARYLGGANGAGVAVGIARAPNGTGYWIAVGPAGAPVPPNSGFGRRIVYSNSMQRVWLIEANDAVSHTWLVSGRRGVPAPGTYHVFSKSPASAAGSLTLPHMTRFAHGRSLSIGFHGIPLRRDGTPIQTDGELGQYRSHGCVRMNQDAAAVLYDWAPLGTTVVVLP